MSRAPSCRAVHIAGFAIFLVGCARPAVPDPRDAALEYARAARAADSAAIYALLSRQSQQELGKEGTARLVTDVKSELQHSGQAVEKGPLTVQASAEIRFVDGESAVLHLESGSFKVGAVGTLPSGATTPTQALDELRQALARRSYPALVRVMSRSTRGAMENDLAALVEGLEDPQTLQVEEKGDRATVQLPDGHVVELKREDGVWKVENFR
jgi:hypothetical protein